MFGKKAKEKEQSLFNVSINLDGWQGPYDSLRYFLIIAEDASKFYKYSSGFYHVYKNGKLCPGEVEGLHKFTAQVDFPHPDHMHYDGGRIMDIKFKDNDLFITNHGEILIHTLEGLYNLLQKKDFNTKIRALSDRLNDYPDYQNFLKSISTRKTTRLKLLENIYRKNVSNQ